ncbi:MAG: LL-diaminopimelate aminotransferase [Coleofasciculaceae cyanobacterium RL_1_1]|nr:LL-diaminopimelate aminotransferase [Coleofasciculaceae cyanobacterium RL_1_1]
MRFAQRLAPLERNVFADMDRAKATAIAAGRDLIDLSLGSSDLPTPQPVLDVIARSLDDQASHQYLLFNNTRTFRRAAAQWYTDRYGIHIDPETEVLPLIGSQEGTAHIPLALLEPGDFALLQDPGYPSHSGGVHLAGGQIHPMPLLAENNFLPDFSQIPDRVLDHAKLMVLSYPHNPTSAIASLDFFREAVAFCERYDLVLVHDFPYGDLVFSGDRPPSILQADTEKQRSIEFFTMSKSYNMGGFRVGYAIGNAELILALRRIKAAVDFNQYRGILNGAIEALTGDQTVVSQTVETFRARRDQLVESLAAIGWIVPKPEATMYLWAKLPDRWATDSINFCVRLVQETGVALSPGAGFGASGEGYVRFALVQEPDVLEVAADRLALFLAKT